MDGRSEAKRGVAGEVVGLLTFLGGVAMLVGTFVIAWSLFQAPPEQALGIQPKRALDVDSVARTALGLAYRIVLLVLMSFLASLVANRGIKLYSTARSGPHERPPAGGQKQPTVPATRAAE